MSEYNLYNIALLKACIDGDERKRKHKTLAFESHWRQIATDGDCGVEAKCRCRVWSTAMPYEGLNRQPLAKGVLGIVRSSRFFGFPPVNE
jgi:hypothetical protein